MRCFVYIAIWVASSFVQAGQPSFTLEAPLKPPAGFFQVLTPCCTVETNVSQAYTQKVATMIRNAETKFYQLFQLTPELMQGLSKDKFDRKANIPGTILSDIGFRQWIEVRVHKTMESFSDEWFDQINVTDKQQRLTQGIPGAYFSTHRAIGSDGVEEKKMLRSIRSFVSNRDDDELERTLLHEMGHLFMHSYMLEFGGGSAKGKENEKRGTPAWLSEGMAQLFENLWSNAASSKKERLKQQAMIYEAIKIGDSYPFDEFLNITNAHNLAAVAGNPLKATLNYAQSASVMDYMVHVDGTRFFNFLQNLREMHFKQRKTSELFSIQNDAFKSAFNADLKQVEDLWKKNTIKTMDEIFKKSPETRYWIGEYYLRRGKDKVTDYAKAEEQFNQAMQEAPTKGEGYLGTGRMAMRKGNNELALATLQKAAELMPKDDDALYYYGVAQINAGQCKEALESFDKSLKVWPRNERALYGKGQAAFHAGQYEKSMEAFSLAYDAGHNPRYLFERGNAAFFGKKYRDAQTAYATFEKMFPTDAQGVFWYGLSAWRLGEDRKFALEKLQAAAKLDPKDDLIKTAVAMAMKGETIKFQREADDIEAAKDVKDGKDGKTPKKAPKPEVHIDDE